MKASELMIGDWVQIVEPCKYAGAIGRIKTLIDHKDDENAYFKVFLQNNTIHIGIEDICSEDIRPISLIPEILDKNGFEASKDFNMRYWSKSYDEIIKVGELEEGHLYLEAKGKKGRYEGDCNFLHELQHALRLCGIDKKIEL